MPNTQLKISNVNGSMFQTGPTVATVVDMSSDASALAGRRLARIVVGRLCQRDLLIHAVSQPFIEGLLNGLTQAYGEHPPKMRVVVLTDQPPSELAQQRFAHAEYIWMLSSDRALRAQLFDVFEGLCSLSHLNALCGKQGVFDLDESSPQCFESSKAFMLVPCSSEGKSIAATALSLSPSLWDSDLWLIESAHVHATKLVRVSPWLAVS